MLSPPLLIRCESCGTKSDLGVGLPTVEPARMVKLNRGVESFVADHRPCSRKEGK